MSLLAAVIAALTVLVAAGCEPTPPPLGPPPGPPSLVVGDSIIWMSTAQVKAANPKTDVVANSGHTWAEMIPKIPARRFGTTVVLLGYNDISRNRINQGEIEQMLTLLKSKSECTIALVPPQYQREWGRAAGVAHNKALEAAAKKVRVPLAWDLYGKSWPYATVNLTIEDRNHPNEAGKKQIASSVKVAATACKDRRDRLPA